MISNEAYEAAWRNINNVRMMRKAASNFAKGLDKDERIECMQLGLLRALRSYEPDKGQKFTTWLYRYVYWECQRAMKKRSRGTVLSLSDLPDIAAPVHPRQEEISHIHDCLDLLPTTERELIRQRYLMRMTFREIGDANDYTHAAAYQKVTEATDQLRRICLRA